MREIVRRERGSERKRVRERESERERDRKKERRGKRLKLARVVKFNDLFFEICLRMQSNNPLVLVSERYY